NTEEYEMRSEERQGESRETFEVGHFRPEDAAGIVRLFREVYGDDYPIKIFYDDQELTEANAEGRYHSIVARNPEGEVIGVQHLYQSAPYDRLYEVGAGVVLREFRNLGIGKRSLEYLYEEWIPRRDDIDECFGEAVCNHPYMQRISAVARFIDMAIEIALMPAQAYVKEASASGRVAAVLCFRCYRRRPQAVYVPSVYEDELRYLYARLDDKRELKTARAGAFDECESEVETAVFDFAQVARIAVRRAGRDFASRIEAVESEARSQNAIVIQVWLPANSTAIDPAVDALRERGYFFGGPLPRWFDHDGLLMQKLHCPPDFDAIQLHSDDAKRLLEWIERDYRWTRY
ncbi:MAG: GNAT family N-acetyltransferase, partial [Acidobacteriota bacterium]